MRHREVNIVICTKKKKRGFTTIITTNNGKTRKIEINFTELKERNENGKINEKETTFFPANTARLSQASPIYETVPGWDVAFTETKDFNDLPANAKNFICLIEEMIKTPITIIGVGPERTQTIFR